MVTVEYKCTLCDKEFTEDKQLPFSPRNFCSKCEEPSLYPEYIAEKEED